ncbi:hypothetical protein [Mycobacterium palustre]|uniref:hypothetical protein n=1 Tax=Mycobacterium palustre TaxID=153971 RepID=UPI00115467C4|nr:hypothetical protein [Mycobacterium palustre]
MEVAEEQCLPSSQRARSFPRCSGLPAAYAALATLLVATVIWLVALPRLRADQGGQYGLLATPGGALLLAAVTLAVIAFAVSIAANRGFTAGFAVLLVILFERLTVTLIAPLPIYTYTYQHIGVIDYILKYRALPLPRVDLYNQWPGFFGLMSWFSSVAHVDPVDVAHWFTPLVDVLIAVVVASLGLALGFGLRVALTAAMFAQVVNWVGQDYFSPQAVALFMTIAMLVMLASSNEFPAAGYLSVPIFAALTATHQLTPVWVTGLCTALAIFRQVSPRWLPAAYAMIEIAYVIPRYPYIKHWAYFSNPLHNLTASGSLKVVGRPSDGRIFNQFVQRGLSASVWLLAAICFYLLWKRIGVQWALGLMTCSSVLVLGQSYGGECILRVFLYSLVGCSILLATFVADALSNYENGRQILTAIAASVLLITLTAAGLQSYFSWWSVVTVTQEELDASRRMLAENSHAKLVTMIAPQAGWPMRPSADYVRLALADKFYDNSLDDLNISLLNGPPKPEDFAALERDANSKQSPIYFALPHQLYAYDEYFGVFKPGTISGLIDLLSHRPGWVREIDDADILEFKYVGS